MSLVNIFSDVSNVESTFFYLPHMKNNKNISMLSSVHEKRVSLLSLVGYVIDTSKKSPEKLENFYVS